MEGIHSYRPFVILPKFIFEESHGVVKRKVYPEVEPECPGLSALHTWQAA